MAALDTVQDYVNRARTLLQDTVAPYRYLDIDLLDALNSSLNEARRLRPDLFLAGSFVIQFFTAVDATAVNIDQMYRIAFVYFMCGQAQLRDEEATQDARAGLFLGKFKQILLGLDA